MARENDRRRSGEAIEYARDDLVRERRIGDADRAAVREPVRQSKARRFRRGIRTDRPNCLRNARDRFSLLRLWRVGAEERTAAWPGGFAARLDRREGQRVPRAGLAEAGLHQDGACDTAVASSRSIESPMTDTTARTAAPTYDGSVEAAEERRVESKSAALKKELGLRDLVLQQIVFVMGTTWVGTAAKLGHQQMVFWLAAMLFFYLPQAAVVIALTKRMPLEGGLYQWARITLGELWAFLVAWNLWIFAVVLISTIGLLIGRNLSYIVGPS